MTIPLFSDPQSFRPVSKSFETITIYAPMEATISLQLKEARSLQDLGFVNKAKACFSEGP